MRWVAAAIFSSRQRRNSAAPDRMVTASAVSGKLRNLGSKERLKPLAMTAKLMDVSGSFPSFKGGPDRIVNCKWTRTRDNPCRVYQVIGLLVPVSYMHYCTSTLADQPSSLAGSLSDEKSMEIILKRASRLDAFSVITSELSNQAVLLAEQLTHQRFVHPGPLVLGRAPSPNFLRAQRIGNRTVSTYVRNPARVPL